MHVKKKKFEQSLATLIQPKTILVVSKNWEGLNNLNCNKKQNGWGLSNLHP